MSTPERTLLLLRHAKSDYPSGVPDHERPLAPRGIREAAMAGDWIRANAPRVDVVLCSTATRTRQTLERTGLDVDAADVRFDDELYDSKPSTVLGLIKGLPDGVVTVLVVGHEPTTSALAVALTEPDDSPAFDEMSSKFPTSAIAMFRPLVPWDRLGLGMAELIDFHVPR